jgi:5-methylthioadenosine/S-adenosylhomocysteine deaminase
VNTTPMIEADLLIRGATLITLNAQRHVITDGAIAVRGADIVAAGKTVELDKIVRAKRVMDGSRFAITPGFVDGHIHITCDPLTRGFARGGPDDNWGDKLQKWVIPLFKAQTPEEEALAAQVAALNMIKGGTTLFLEAGTVIHLDAVMEALAESKIRGRVGQWVEGRAYSPQQDQTELSRAAIKLLEDEIEKYPDSGADSLLAAWPVLVGHSTNSDDVWRAAKALADQHGLRVSAHMSPRAGDPEWFMGKYNRRPLEHLSDIGVLGENVCLTHLAAIDQSELDCLIASNAHAIHCALAAFQGGFGLSQFGLFPEMLARGVNVMIGTDGMAGDILGSARLMASVFRDAREDQFLFPAGQIMELATLNGARAMGMDRYLGSLEAGKKADFVLHDMYAPEWGAIFDPVAQLALGASPAGVHSVFIDGVQVLDAGRSTIFDEEKLLADARQAGAAIVARTKLPNHTVWPVL